MGDVISVDVTSSVGVQQVVPAAGAQEEERSFGWCLPSGRTIKKLRIVGVAAAHSALEETELTAGMMEAGAQGTNQAQVREVPFFLTGCFFCVFSFLWEACNC